MMRLAAGTLAILLSGCATIVSKSEETIGLRSNPQEASVEIINKAGVSVFKGTTPTQVTLTKRRGYFQGETYNIVFTKPEHAEHRVTLDTQPSAWYLGGNILFGGLVGWLVVDPATGAMWAFDKDAVEGALTRPALPATPAPK